MPVSWTRGTTSTRGAVDRAYRRLDASDNRYGTGPLVIAAMTIQHTVVFRMNADADADHFFSRARELAAIRGVTDFEVLRQVGHKSEFSHGLSMYFDDDAAYDTYLDHPDHLAFVNDVWLPNVADFLELDFVRDRAAR